MMYRDSREHAQSEDFRRCLASAAQSVTWLNFTLAESNRSSEVMIIFGPIPTTGLAAANTNDPAVTGVPKSLFGPIKFPRSTEIEAR